MKVPSAPLSAIAARRLRSEQQQQQQQKEEIPTTPSTPQKISKTPKKKTSTSSQSTERTTNTAIDAQDTAAIQRKRLEIERQIAEKVIEIKGPPSIPITKPPATPAIHATSAIPEYGTPVVEESALARLRRQRAAPASSTVSEEDDVVQMDVDVEEDVEMMSADGESDEEMGGLRKKRASFGRVERSVGFFMDMDSSTPKVVELSTFKPNKENYIVSVQFQGAGGIEAHVRMYAPETLTFVGQYNLQVKKGAITLAGITLTPDSGTQTVYATATHALPEIKCLHPLSRIPSRKGDKKKQKKAQKNDEDDDGPHAVIIVSSHHSGLGNISKLCPTFNGIWTPNPGSTDWSGESFVPLITSSYNFSVLSISEEWQRCFDSVKEKVMAPQNYPSPPVILVSGGKGAGKSTFARTLLNKLLEVAPAVVYLDVDPGQPEFSPPGMVSLARVTSPIFGPPFTHPNNSENMIRSHHVGFTSPKEDPGHYIACAADLFLEYQSLLNSSADERNTPLIINTAGWTKGLGLELLNDIVQRCQPTDVVYLSPPEHEKNSPLVDIIPEGVTVHNIDSISSNTATTASRYSSADFRALQIMSYMHYDPVSEKWDFDTPLTGRAPWVVPYTGPEAGINGISILGEEVAPHELTTAIDGTLLGVVLIHDELPDPIPSPADVANPLPMMPPAFGPLQPDRSFCIGTALIRGIDFQKGCLQLLAPIKEEVLERWVDGEGMSVVLVRGRIELPVWEVVKGMDGARLPWVGGVSMKGAGAGAEVWRVRRNVMRRGHQW
ncbi:Polynucleotide 5'-hydroxyl-kinase grc3 [Rhizina undulata]